jgi:hypothetical protein
VSYGRSPIEVYTQLARAVIQNDNNFNILGYLGAALPQKNLPTWVPDWTTAEDKLYQRLGYSREPNLYSAGGNASPSVTFSLCGNEMISYGTILYKITRIGVVAGPGARGRILQNWEAVLSQICVDEYVCGESIADAFIGTILTGHPHTTFAIAKRQFLLWYKDLKTKHPDAFPSCSGILDTEAEAHDLRQDDGDAAQDEQKEKLLSCFGSTSGRRFVITERDYFALVPGHSKEGDHVALFKGSEYPIVLRATGSE